MSTPTADVKAKIRAQHEYQLSHLIAALETCTESRRKAEMHGFPRMVSLYNLGQYALLCNYDLTVLAHDILLTDDPNRRKAYARYLAMTLYESVNDLTQLMGKDFREEVLSLFDEPSWKAKSGQISKGFNEFKKLHAQNLSYIRNIGAGHREQDAAKQLAVINSIDPLEMCRITGDFVQWLEALIQFLTAWLLEWQRRMRPLLDVLKGPA